MTNQRVYNKRSFFARSKAKRDLKCIDKDAVVAGIFKRLKIASPKNYYAILMPALYGPEVRLLRLRGVPAKNMFAIERDNATHALIKDPPVMVAKYLSGILTTARPLTAERAIDHVSFPYANLIYLDFFGQLDFSHLQLFYKMFRLGLVQPRHTTMLVTYGVNRGEAFTCRLNKRLVNAASAGHAYINAALERAGNVVEYKSIHNHPYQNKLGAHYMTTEVRF